MYQILLVDAEQNNRDYAKRLEEMQRTESDLRRNIASLESCCMTQRTSMAQLVQDKVGLCQELKRAESKINDLCQEIATLTSRQQILKGCLRDSSSIIRDILDSN
jgi:chromosome segregation ATPase